MDIYQTLYPDNNEYTFFSVIYGTYSKIDHILSYKEDISEFYKMKLLSTLCDNRLNGFQLTNFWVNGKIL